MVTYLGQRIATNVNRPLSPPKGTTFQDYESFIAFMEQDIPYEYSYKDGVLVIEQMVPDSTIYYVAEVAAVIWLYFKKKAK